MTNGFPSAVFSPQRTETVGALLLAGGQSRRMGRDKRALPFAGARFVDLVTRELGSYPERLFSVADSQEVPPPGFTVVSDQRPGCGPLGGIVAGLEVCHCDALLAVACDMPLFRAGLARYLEAFLCDSYDAFLIADRTGRVHPLCGIYRKTALPILNEQLRAGQYRLMRALERLQVKYVPLEHSAYPDRLLTNVNTWEEYQNLLRSERRPPILAVCGVKNSGKTTFLCRLIPELNRLGLKVAAIKHDGHEFEPDRPGTDSYRLLQAGARGTAVYSHSRYQLVRLQEGVQAGQLARVFDDVDLILLEGGKHSPYPKLELVRAPISSRPVLPPEELLAVCTNLEDTDWGIPRLPLEDGAAAARWIASWLTSQSS